MQTTLEEATGVILVGGKSRRMGRDKALLEVGGRPMIEIVVEAVSRVVPRVLLVGQPAERFARLGMPVHADIYPGSALGGLYTGLLRAGTRHVFAAACDMPCPNPSLMAHLLSLREGRDVVVPRRGALLEPLFAVYSRECLPFMKALLDEGNCRIDDFFPKVRTLYVEGPELDRIDKDGLAFTNINTPEEYRKVAAPRPR